METAKNIGVCKGRKLGFALAALAFLPLALWRPAPGQTAGTALVPAQTTYTLTDLGTLGGTFGLAHGVNNRGQVAGFATLPGDTAQNAFFWQKGAKTEIPSAFGGPDSNEFFKPSESGQVAGQAESATADPHGENFCGDGPLLQCVPFIWQNGVMSPLPLLDGGNNGAAYTINDRGQAAGQSEIGTPDPTCGPTPPPPFFIFLQTRAVTWEDGKIQPLATFPGDTQANALAINDLGQAVGVSGDCFAFQGGLDHSVLWQNGTVTDLGNLGSSNNNGALNINNQGQVVGFSDLPADTAQHAFLWQSGVMTDLGTLPGDIGSFAPGINDLGQVTGGSFGASGNVRAFLWENGTMTDLNTLTPSGSDLFLLAGFDINSAGQITGFAFQLSTGEIHAFLATPSLGGNAREAPDVTLPQDVRKLLQQRVGLGRLGPQLLR
jgi:probable HAF family extracellular repeat protein